MGAISCTAGFTSTGMSSCTIARRGGLAPACAAAVVELVAEALLVMYSMADAAAAARSLRPALCLIQLHLALMLPADLQPTVRASSASRGRMRRQQTLRQRAGLGHQAVHLMGACLWDPLSGACSSVHDAACDLREVSALRSSMSVQSWHPVTVPPPPPPPSPHAPQNTFLLLGDAQAAILLFHHLQH